MLVLAAVFGLFTCALFGLTAMAFPMTKDPDVPFPASVAIVAFLAAITLLSAWVTWGVLRGKRVVGERLLSTRGKGPVSLDSFLFGDILDHVFSRLLSSEEARRWFGLAPPE